MAKKKRSSVKSNKSVAGKVETYIACGSLRSRASATAIQSAYKIEVRFLGGLNTAQKNAFNPLPLLESPE
jgi:hypothetical protein